MTSAEYEIQLIFGPGNMNTFKNLESKYIFPSSFLAHEYEYIYPLGEVNMGPNNWMKGNISTLKDFKTCSHKDLGFKIRKGGVYL